MDFTELPPADPTADPAEARRATASWILGGFGVLVVVLTAFGAWNPGNLVHVDRWLNHPCEFGAALVPLGLYLFYLRSDGDTAAWIARRIALVSLIPLTLTVIGLVAFAPEETTVAVSPSGSYEVVAIAASGDARTFVLRTRDGLLSRQASHPLFCFPSSGGDSVRFVDEQTVEVASGDVVEGGADRVTFDGLDVPWAGCD
ncbi:hypothetical protein R8Z50_28475 [Longispora sp. K20-0274]|uniref:hypothetical protein n=1 Tax=Longispora sp. K20-0274 TaxID=3088255 RepID=UPI00399A4363